MVNGRPLGCGSVKPGCSLPLKEAIGQILGSGPRSSRTLDLGGAGTSKLALRSIKAGIMSILRCRQCRMQVTDSLLVCLLVAPFPPSDNFSSYGVLHAEQ